MQLGVNQQKFVNALRSGEYKQCQNELCQTTENEERYYCCLGVANTIFNLKAENNETLDGTPFTSVLGLYDSDGQIFGCEDTLEYDSLIEMNDRGNKTFVEIADFIEKNPELVFTHSV